MAGLVGQKISHLLIYYPLFDRWMNDNFSLKKQEIVQKFFQEYVKLDYIKNGYGVNKLMSPQ